MVIFDLCAPPWPVSLLTINCWLLPARQLMESPCLSFTCSINTVARHLRGSPLTVLINNCLLGLLALRRCAWTHRVSPSRWFKSELQPVSPSCICKILFNTWCISPTCEINQINHKHTKRLDQWWDFPLLPALAFHIVWSVPLGSWRGLMLANAKTIIWVQTVRQTDAWLKFAYNK